MASCQIPHLAFLSDDIAQSKSGHEFFLHYLPLTYSLLLLTLSLPSSHPSLDPSISLWHDPPSELLLL